ncbi:hypothetical protein GCM10007304_00410 [Rhodococcoides trifolii]|uniref:Uncharacterized protein n=1 Tax=Rhodococcoides trifolii TaxID=908250 RepID=A0A917FLT9_9NOCA|nr:DUF6492 family protein [Rhodococcus trifolii]GGF90437.1 hypothetical protein GCM10007304_00410 [Rhodococcus trifolii]
MTSLDILTPSYRPDFELFEDLHNSVLRFTDSARHRVVVPSGDLELFRSIRSPRLDVTSVDAFLPRTMFSVRPATRWTSKVGPLEKISKIHAIDARQPWPPLRGWILQQIVKLAAAAASTADTVLIIDSDVSLIAELSHRDVRRGSATRFYADPAGVTLAMTEHQRWHDNARRLLGLQATQPHVRPDYIAGFITWEPAVVRDMLAHVSSVAGKTWLRAVSGSLHFSECTLYGTYMDHIADEARRAYTRPTTRCASHWDPVSLTASSAEHLIDDIDSNDVALQIQSTSRTPIDLRRTLIADAIARRR